MDDVVKKSLHDILSAIEEVEGFFGDKPCGESLCLWEGDFLLCDR